MELESLQIQITSDAHNATAAINNLISRLTSLKTALSGFNNISFGNIVASANSANSSFRSLTTTISNLSQNMRTAKGSMTELGGRLSEIRVDSSAASSIETVAAAIRKLGSKTIVTATRNLPELTVTLRNFAKEINELGIVNFDTASMTGVISSIAKLGGKASTQATKNLPTISAQLQNFVRQMNQIGSFSFDMINLSQMVAAIGKLGSVASGRAVNNIPLLAKNLKELFVTLSSAPNVSGNIIRMTEALANLSTGLGRTRSATSNASSGMNLFGKNVDSVRIKSFSLASAIGKVYATYFLLFRGIEKIKDAIDISSAVTEADNVVRQAFGKYERLVDDLCKVSIKKFGMSELSVKQFAGRFQSLGTALDIPQGKMAKMAIKLTELTGDLASYYDVSQEDVAKSLQSVFTGTTAPMRRYGVDLTQATLNEWLMKKGIDAKVKSMNQAQKAIVRYEYTLERTKAAQGDFLRTSDSWHNTLTVVTESFKDLGKTVGDIAINAFKPFLRVLGIVAEKVNSFVEMVLNALGSIFGWKFEVSKKGASGLTDSLNGAYDSMDDLSNAAGNAGKNTGGIAKNAKKAKKEIQQATRAFDELKVISKQSKDNTSDSGSGGSGGSGGGSGGSGGGDTGTWVETPSAFKKFKSSIKDLEGLGIEIRKALVKAVSGIEWDKIYAKASGFGTGLAEFLNGLFSEDKKGNSVFTATADVIAGALNTAIFASKGFTDKFKFETFGKNVAHGFNRFFKKFKWKQCAEAINGWVDGFWKFVRGFFDDLSWKDIFNGLKTFLTNLSPTTIATIIGARAFSRLGKNFYKLIKSAITKNLDKKLSKAITKKLSLVKLGGGIAGTLATGFVIAATITVAVQFSKDFKEWIDNIKKYGWVEGRKKTARDNKANPYNNGRAISDKDVENYEEKAKKRANANSANPYNLNSKYSEKVGKIKNAANPYDANSVKSHKTLEFQAKIKTTASELWKKLKSDWDKIKNKYADFKARVKDNAKEWWENTKEYWSKKVGKVKEFTTDVKDSAKEWWSNTKKYWGQKVGQVKKFTTAVQNDASKWWSNTKKYWAEKVGKVKEFTTGVKNKAGEWWSNVKKWWESTTAGKEVKRFTVNVKRAGGTWWKDVSNEWKEKVINAGRTLKIGISFATNALKNLWSSVSTFFSGKTVNVKTKGSTTKKADGGVFSGGSWKPIKKYAVGGLPNMGQMFVAREAGPELVGTLGGHTAVMNNDQIVSSVSYGVAQAVKEVIQPLVKTNAGNNRPIQISLDGKVIFDSTRQSAQEYFNRTGVSPFPV
jgi:hypothetical protein